MFVFVQAATSRVQAFQSLQETNTKLTNRAQHQHWGTGSKAHKYTSSLAGHRGTAHTSRAQLTHKQGTAQEEGTQDTQHRHRQLTHTQQTHTAHTDTADKENRTVCCSFRLCCHAWGLDRGPALVGFAARGPQLVLDFRLELRGHSAYQEER